MLEKLFGASWVTSLMGYLAIFFTWLNQVFIEQGVPQSGKEWSAFVFGNIVGLIGVFSKDQNVSNSGTNAVPHKVTATVPRKVT